MNLDEAPTRSSAVRSRRVRIHLGVLIGVFLLSRFVMFAGGVTFDANPPGQIHLLDMGALARDPFLAFTSNNIQPPLFNFFVGVVLRWTPFPVGISFQVLYFGVGLATVIGLWLLLCELGAKRWMATVATVLVGSSPLMIRNERILTYETLVTAILVASALACVRVLRRPGPRRLAVFAATMAIGVLTRGTLQPLWLVGGLALVLVVSRHRTAWRPCLAVAAISCLVVAGPLLVNLHVHGAVGYSSYAGMNLERISVTTLSQTQLDRLVAEGKLSPAAKVAPFSSYRHYAAYFPDCRTDTGSPVIDDVDKASVHQPNYNARCYLPVYDQARHDAVAAIRAEPGNYLSAVFDSSLLYVGWDRYSAGPRVQLWRDWVDLYSPIMLQVSHQYGEQDAQPYTEIMWRGLSKLRVSVTTGLALILSVAYGIRTLVRARRRRADPVDWTRLFIAFTVISISSISVTADTFENARFREPLDPLLFGPFYVLVLVGIDRLIGVIRLRLAEGRATDAAVDPSDERL